MSTQIEFITDVIIKAQNWNAGSLGMCKYAEVVENLLLKNPKLKQYSEYTKCGKSLYCPERYYSNKLGSNSHSPLDMCINYCTDCNNLSFEIIWHSNTENFES